MLLSVLPFISYFLGVLSHIRAEILIELPTLFFYAKIDLAGKTDDISALRTVIGNNRCISGFIEKAEIKDE